MIGSLRRSCGYNLTQIVAVLVQVALVFSIFSFIGEGAHVKTIELENGDPDPFFIDDTRDDFRQGENFENTEAWYPGDVKLVIENGVWADKTSPSGPSNYGVALTADGTYIYIFKTWTTGSWYFKRYDPIGDSWDDLPTPPYRPKTGCDLAWDGGNYLYALFGGAYSDRDDDARKWFMRYDISAQTWESLENTPYRQHAGASLVWVEGEGENYIYAFIGGGGPEAETATERDKANAFLRFYISENHWYDDVENLPSPLLVNDGGSLVWTRDNYIYAFTGAYGSDLTEAKTRKWFLRFSIPDNQWYFLENVPNNVDDGGSLLWIGGDSIFALTGVDDFGDPDNGDDFWRYSIFDDNWYALENIPYGVGGRTGHRLGWVNNHIYYWQGYYDATEGNQDNFCMFRHQYYRSGRFISQKFTTGNIENWQEIGWRTTLGDNRYVVVEEPNPLVDGNPRAGEVTGGSYEDTRTINGVYENITEDIAKPTPRLNWEHRIGGVATGYGRYILRVRGYTSGPDGDNVSVYIWDNDLSDWEFIDNLTTTEMTIEKVIPGPQISRYLRDDNFSVRYATENFIELFDDETTAHIDLCALEAVSIGIFARASADGVDWTGWEGPYPNPLGSPIGLDDNQYIQYRAEFETGDNLITPVLEWVRINYTHLP